MSCEALSSGFRADVLVVGAGPTGLMSALYLHQAGLRIRIVDKREGPSSLTKASLWTDPALAAMARLGLDEALFSSGWRVRAVKISGAKGRTKLCLPVDQHGEGFPFLFSTSQEKAERLLAGRLRDLGVQVEWGQAFKEIREDSGDRVRAVVADQEASYRWVFGCDGSRSTVRADCGIGLAGKEEAGALFVGDGTLEWEEGREQPETTQGYLGKKASYVFFQLDEDKAYRIGGSARKVEEVALKEMGIKKVNYAQPEGLQGFTYSEQVAKRFWSGKRVFLLGDAAHKFSPCLGKGMNLGIGDAENLSWKVASVFHGLEAPSLLESYERERRPVAKRVVWETSLAARMQTAFGGLLAWIRDRALGVLHMSRTLQKMALGIQSHKGWRYPLRSNQKDPRLSWLPFSQLHVGQRFPLAWVMEENQKEPLCRSLSRGQTMTAHHLLVLNTELPLQVWEAVQAQWRKRQAPLARGRAVHLGWNLPAAFPACDHLSLTGVSDGLAKQLRHCMKGVVVQLRPDGFIEHMWRSVDHFLASETLGTPAK